MNAVANNNEDHEHLSSEIDLVVDDAERVSPDLDDDDDMDHPESVMAGDRVGDDEDLNPQFWMATRQTQCGAVLTERMVSFMKSINAAQAEFADKLAAISSVELARAKNGSNDSAVYQQYWIQMQLAMRLCKTWSQSSKEMTGAIGQLIAPMDRIVHVGRSRLKESANWNVELNKALSVFHTNVAKRQAKCYKALSVVMTPEYFDQSPVRKSQAVRRAAPTVTKYIEQIDEANNWLSKYMAQRPSLKGRLEALEEKRIEVSRNALITFASQMQLMGQTMVDAAQEISSGVGNIDDLACKRAFIVDCRALPTPHLENPALFEYALPVPISELGIRGVREPRPSNVPASRLPSRMYQDDGDLLETASNASSAAASTGRRQSAVEEAAEPLGRRISTFANRMFGGNATGSSSPAAPVRPAVIRAAPAPAASANRLQHDADIDLLDDFEEAPSADQYVADDKKLSRFGNIPIKQAAAPVSHEPMRIARRSSAVANVSSTVGDFDDDHVSSAA